jgi:hypothetical protein
MEKGDSLFMDFFVRSLKDRIFGFDSVFFKDPNIHLIFVDILLVLYLINKTHTYIFCSVSSDISIQFMIVFQNIFIQF